MRPLKLFRSIIIAIIHATLQPLGASFIDTNHPIVISDGTATTEKSNFGYTISGFSSPTSNRASIYIGAPTSARLSSRGTRLDTGDVWQCGMNLEENPNPIFKNDARTISCTPWNGISKASSTQRCCSTDCISYTSGMWLGGSLSAIDDNGFVTCGPHWSTKIGDDIGVHGYCYQAQNGNVKLLEPPLRYSDQITSGSGNLIWYYAQTGFSSVLDNSKTLLLAGSPGYFGWRGNAILYNLNERQESYCKVGTQFKTVFGTNSRRTGGDSADYFGYHVASGQYNFGRETIFAVGAPRGHGDKGNKHMAGFVTLLSVNPKNVHGQNWIEIIDNLLGEQLGSYFGAFVAFADVNGDGFDEIFVGSPHHTVGQNSESYDEGCVFVYSRNSTGGQIQYKNSLVEQLCPSIDSGSHFGFAIANLGDIDQDGYTDIGVSAPGSNQGIGEVFVYYGHPNFPLSSHPHNPQRIGASETNIINGLKGFGSTLFGNVDLDGNGTPDMLIGASTTNQVIIYRTRPRLQLVPRITNHNNNNMETDSPAIYKLRRNETSFRLQFCLSSQRQPSIDGKLDIQVEAKFDPTEERFQFANKGNIFKFTLPVVNDNEQSCSNVHVDRVKELEQQNPSRIKVIWEMKYNNARSEIQQISTLSVSANGQARVSQENDIFCTWCPKSHDQIYHHFLPVATDNCDEDGNTICNSKLKVVTSFRHIKGINNANLNTYVIGPHTGSRFLDVVLENDGETAYSPTVIVDVTFSKPELSSSFTVRLTPSPDGNRRCQFNQNKAVCRDPMHTGQREYLSFTLTISPTLTAMPNEENLRIRIKAYPEPHPEQAATSNYVELKLVSEVNLTLTELNSERKDININEANAVFKSSYEIGNSGASPAQDVHFQFQIPFTYGEIFEEEQEALIIYMPKPNNRITCISPRSQGFPSLPTMNNAEIFNNGMSQEFPNGTIPGPAVSRRRRQTTEQSNPNAQKQQKVSNAENMVYVDCIEFPKWKCIEISCKLQPLTPLTSNDPLTVDLNLGFSKNATGSIIPPESTVFVKTAAKIWKFEDRASALSASATTTLQAQGSGDIPAYLIFLSGIGGLVIFLLIAFGLFKCGFFRRKTKENLQNLKAQAQQEDLLAENFPIPASSDNEDD